ncbi:transposase domain-containing protein, partial [Salmonella enterica]|uniref:transposase domain-containing protein n=1 Tax=Salmonella enterica TaxID=28901 RepID=UPI003FA73559
ICASPQTLAVLVLCTCRLNDVEPEKWMRYVIEHIQDWPANRVRDLLPWKVDLSSQ